MGRFLISSASGSEICPAPLSASPQLTAHLYLGKELKEENEEAVVEATAARWSQPDLLERGKRNIVKREEVAPQTRLPAPLAWQTGASFGLRRFGSLLFFHHVPKDRQSSRRSFWVQNQFQFRKMFAKQEVGYTVECAISAS